MPVVWHSFAAASRTLGNDPVITKPSGTVDGDLLVCVFGASSGTVAAPVGGGWTEHPASLLANSKLFWKIASGEPADYTFTATGTANSIGVISRYSGHDPSNPIDVASGVVGGGAMVIPSVTTTKPGRFLAQMVAKLTNNTTFTEPGTAAERFDANGFAGGQGTVAGGDEIVAAAGATGTRTWTPAAGASGASAYMFAINPASQTLTVTGFDTTVLFGAPTLIQDQFVSPAGFDVAVQFGTPTLVPDQTITATGFDLLVDFGTPTVILDNVLLVAGFDLTVSFGTVTVARQPFVTATVYDHETGLPVGAGAVVQLFDADGLLLDETVTDAGGVYIFHLPQGFTDQVFTVVRVTIDGTPYQGVSELCPVQT